MPKPATAIGCHHSCPLPKHTGGPVLAGSPDVFYEGAAACRQNDPMACESGTDTVAAGSPTVYVNGRQAARLGDPSVHGGQIVQGARSVFIG